jgi:hypothetical protein
MNPIGIDLSGSEYSWGSFSDASQLDLLQSEGINLVRLPIAWERIQPTLYGPLDTNYLQGLETFLNEAAARNIKVVVDIHDFGRYDTTYANDSIELTTDSALSTPITLPANGSYSFEVSAKGISASSLWPSMQVSLDGNPIGTATVASDALGNYDFTVNASAGAHTVSIAFANNTGDLYVSQLRVTGPGSFAADLSALNMPGRPESAAIEINTAPGNGAAIGTADVPVSAFTDLWTKLATALVGNPGVAGYDLMNEPHDMPSPTTWPAAAQAAVNAIRAVDQSTTIYVEGDDWASAANWLTDNANLHIVDPSNKIVYEAHAYFDANGSGNYAESYDLQGAYPTIGVTDIQPFLQWLKETGNKGYLGEFGVPSNDPRWLTVLGNVIQALQAAGVPGTYWSWTYPSAGGPSWWPPTDPTDANFLLNIIAPDGTPHPQLATLFASEAPVMAADVIGAGGQVTLLGTAAAHCKVQIFDGTTPIGSTTALANGSWSYPVPEASASVVLVKASMAAASVIVHSFTADMVDPFGDISGLSKPFLITEGSPVTYLFDLPPRAGAPLPHISNFAEGQDQMALKRTVIVGGHSELVSIAVTARNFYAAPGATEAHTAAQHFIYNETTGVLRYDPDGNGPHPAMKFAVLDGHPALTFHDFVVVA